MGWGEIHLSGVRRHAVRRKRSRARSGARSTRRRSWRPGSTGPRRACRTGSSRAYSRRSSARTSRRARHLRADQRHGGKGRRGRHAVRGQRPQDPGGVFRWRFDRPETDQPRQLDGSKVGRQEGLRQTARRRGRKNEEDLRQRQPRTRATCPNSRNCSAGPCLAQSRPRLPRTGRPSRSPKRRSALARPTIPESYRLFKEHGVEGPVPARRNFGATPTDPRTARRPDSGSWGDSTRSTATRSKSSPE